MSLDPLVSIQKRLLSYAIKLTRNRMDAEDLLQETNIKILNKLETFKTDKDMFHWGASVLHNLFIDKTQRDKRSPITRFDKQQRKYIDIEYLINYMNHEHSDKRGLMKLMGKEIRQLKNIKMRSALIMRKMGYSYNEILTFLEINKFNNLKALIYRGKLIIYDRLRARFKA
jgi:RNA polymerase sigma-70 factor (ECF subfamily)